MTVKEKQSRVETEIVNRDDVKAQTREPRDEREKNRNGIM
jgi:hypothetical protein